MGAAGQPERVAVLLPLLRRWQAERLARTYADLAADKRYAPAAAFFLSDIYGERDSSERDRAVARAYPLIRKVLPKAALAPIERAIELHALSVKLDTALAGELAAELAVSEGITESAYAQSYRLCDNRAERLRQIELAVAAGADLDRVVAKPLVGRTLILARRPARAAGFGELQDFLERGFAAFRHMGGAGAFLKTIETREKLILERLFAGQPRPFDI
ncbi:MAG TPA: hypothetical protein VFJ70_21545 [Burkholderiales bacterium]|nr:hypothetical protein [Burkholderiales bacterium]